jgi:hypothetical protein
MYARKFEKAKNAIQSDRFAGVLARANQAYKRPEYIEDQDGNRIRIWGDGMVDWVKDEDVRSWLLGLRVIEDLNSGLEFVRESYIKSMVAQGYLRKINGWYWVTRKAADRFNLPKVMGCDFPK